MKTLLLLIFSIIIIQLYIWHWEIPNKKNIYLRLNYQGSLKYPPHLPLRLFMVRRLYTISTHSSYAMVSSSHLAFRVNCCLQRPSVSDNFHRLKTSLFSTFKVSFSLSLMSEGFSRIKLFDMNHILVWYISSF
jgi:hypothetical protein